MRNIVGEWFRKGDRIKTISYGKIDNGLARFTMHLFQKGEPGDVIQFTHRFSGMLIGEMKVRVGKIETRWIWD